MRLATVRLSLLASVFAPITLRAQAASVAANPADVSSPEALVRATYETVSRAPGKPFQWDRLRSLFLPGARMIPNTEQTGGTFTTHTVESFITWIDESWKRVGREINSIQMVRKDGRWWITSIIWDEETGAGPVPAKYLPTTR